MNQGPVVGVQGKRRGGKLYDYEGRGPSEQGW